MDPPPLPLPPLTAHPKTLMMSWDGGCKVSWIWNHSHLCLMALSPLSENCPKAWFPFCSYISAWLECAPNALAQRKRNKWHTICLYCLDEVLLDLIKTHFAIQETLSCWHHSFYRHDNPFSQNVCDGLVTQRIIFPHKQIIVIAHLSVAHHHTCFVFAVFRYPVWLCVFSV